MNKKTRAIVFIAFYVALALVLDYVSELIPFLKMPEGGSINLAVISIFVASYHLGWKNGAVTGFLWWLVGCIFGQNSWYLNPMQYLLDYIVPMTVCGVASAFPKIGKVSNVFTGLTVTMFFRYACQVLSGVFFYFESAGEGVTMGSLPAWIYSLGYNFGFNFVTLIIAAIITPILINRLCTLRNIEFVGLKK